MNLESAQVEGVESEAPAEAVEVVPPPSRNRGWFVIHTYAGYENKVQANLEKRLETLGMQDKIFRILVPTEEVAEMRDGKRKISKKKFFPGYVLVEMEMDEEAWYVVRNTPGVTNFVGSSGKPQPLSEHEVEQILRQMGLLAEKPKPRPKVLFEVGESVRITDGPFRDFVGIIEEANPERGKLKVMVTIFGRSAPVELDFLQVSRL